MTPCIPSTGRRHPKGYRYAPGGKLAHRAAWEAEHGPIPPGAVVDHTCHNTDPDCPGGNSCPHRACVNLEHLALSTPGQNVRDGFAGRGTCKSGRHERTGPGLCEPCRRERWDAWYAANLDEQRRKARERMRARRAAARA